MSPISMANLPGAIRTAVARGVRDGIRREVLRIASTGLPRKAGLAAGALIMFYGYRAIYRHDRWKRIEAKIDRLLNSKEE